MSEIFAPGSVAGPQGLAGPAGSQGSVTMLETSLRAAPVNLFNFAASQQNYVTGNDGGISLHPGVGGGPSWVTNLLYCPGATQLICNHAIAATGFGPGAFVQLFDANGTLLSVLAPSGGYKIDPWTVLALPGSQVYVRLTLIDGPGGGTPPAYAMICAGTSGSPASIPAYVSFASYASSVVDANVATALTTAKNYGVDQAQGLLSFLLPANANLFNPAAASAAGYALKNDGTVLSSPWDSGGIYASGLIFCPGATAFLCNTPVMCDNFDGSGTTVGCQLFDAAGKYTGTAAIPSLGGDRSESYTTISLPGTQTYIRISLYSLGGNSQGTTPANSMVFAGPAGSLAAMRPTTPFIPFYGALPTVNGLIHNVTKCAGKDLGAVMDCIVATGLTATGGSPTDNTAVLNAFLATASSSNPVKLILDGGSAVSGLIVAAQGYTTIEGANEGCGLFVIGGANQNAISIGCGAGPYDYTRAGNFNLALPTRSVANVTLRDFTVNPNGHNNSNSFGVLFANCTNILMDHMNFLEAPWFASTFSNCANINVRGCTFTSGGTLHDGVHLDGPVEDVRISDCVFATGDDAIAINCPEGYGGDISRVTVVNCIFDNSLTVTRIYTSLQPAAMSTNNVHKARQITFSNCIGRTRICAFSLGINGPSGQQSTTDVDQIEDLLIENCDIQSDTINEGLGWILVSDAVGLLKASNCIMRSPTSTAPFIMFNGTSQVGDVVLSDITILRNPTGHSTPALFDNTNAISVGKLTIQGARVTDEVGSSYTAIPAALVFGAPLSVLTIHAMEMEHFSALASSFSNVTAARGAGLLGTGVQIADATMASNVLYLSSNAGGAPSIKVGGVARRLTLA